MVKRSGDPKSRLENNFISAGYLTHYPSLSQPPCMDWVVCNQVRYNNNLKINNVKHNNSDYILSQFICWVFII